MAFQEILSKAKAGNGPHHLNHCCPIMEKPAPFDHSYRLSGRLFSVRIPLISSNLLSTMGIERCQTSSLQDSGVEISQFSPPLRILDDSSMVTSAFILAAQPHWQLSNLVFDYGTTLSAARRRAYSLLLSYSTSLPPR